MSIITQQTSNGFSVKTSLIVREKTWTCEMPKYISTGTNNNEPCQSSPCLNGGLCVNKSQTYSCYCQSSPHDSIITTGNRCELQIDLSQTQSK